MKTCQASIKQRTPKMGRKRYRMMNDPSLGIKKKPPTKGRWQGQHEQIKHSNPLARPYQISNKERGGTHARTLNLEEPSPIVIACLEIEATYTRCKTIDTFCL
jgi:hypothetical protein